MQFNILIVLKLTGMNVRVFLHVRLLMKPLAAVLAGIRSGVGMDQKVGAESARTFEGFSALFALQQNKKLSR